MGVNSYINRNQLFQFHINRTPVVRIQARFPSWTN